MRGGHTFVLTSDHIKLLRAMFIDESDDAPRVNAKRPYGNSDIEADVCKLLGWTKGGDDGNEPCWSSAQRKEAWRLHDETPRALQIVLRTGAFEPGKYVTSATWLTDWTKAP